MKKFLKFHSKEGKINPTKGVHTNGIKKKFKAMKHAVGKEVKHSIDISKRRDSVYTPLADQDEKLPVDVNMAASQPKKPNTGSKKKVRFDISSDNSSVKESDSSLIESEITPKKKKKKSSATDDVVETLVNDLSPGKRSKTKKEKLKDKKPNDDVNSSLNDPLLTDATGDSRDSRTIFIGNLPVNFKKKAILKLLKTYGNIEKMWTRGAIPAIAKLPKKVAINKSSLPEEHPPLMVYALFKSAADAHKALNLNGEMFEDNRLRVTLSREKKFSTNQGVFVGNLPFNVKDDDLYQMFEKCGEISNVRIIRCSSSGAGKGFGYVNFKEVDAVELALNLNEEKLQGREIRVQRLLTAGKQKKMEKRKGRELMKSSSNTDKVSLPARKGKIKVPSKTAENAEKRIKMKNKLNASELKKKVLAKKLLLKSKKKSE